MSVEVSLIMISHNKYPQNLYSLYALQNQTFDHEKMEVILVDDCSTDETPLLEKCSFPYRFRYLRYDKNLGRARAKNVGVEASEGRLLILLDTEMILDPEYVEQHYKLHQAEEHLIVTGCLNHYNTFTVYEKNFNKGQKRKFFKAHESSPFPAFHVDETKMRENKLALCSEVDILQLNYGKLSHRAPFFEKIIKQFGTRYEGFHMPYIFVITHNISLKRSTFDQIGPFYEEFQGWGVEDWEFGFRAYKLGVTIMDNPDVRVYHQEHPRNKKDQHKDSLVNYRIFSRLHPAFEVGVQALCWVGKDMLEANELIVEYKAMMQEGRFSRIPQTFNVFFDTILSLLIADQKVGNLLHHSGLVRSSSWNNEFSAEMEQARLLGRYPKLIGVLEWLLKL